MALTLLQILPFCVILLIASVAASTQKVLQSTPPEHDQYAPTQECARANANIIFNAVHSAARQWGSSVHHNGLSLIPVTVPEGTLLYHGSSVAEIPSIPEWLAFEVEHAEYFSRSRMGRKPSNPGRPRWDPGYLHIYQSDRALRLLYFDGMSAGTASPLGTSDMQQMMFLNQTWEECCDSIFDYGKAMCDKAAEWGVEGFVRMEAGFEVIKCDFSDGISLVSASRRPIQDSPEGRTEGWIFGWIRAMALRYQGIDASRIIVDFSSMLHAGFYPTNLTNPDPKHAHLPRLASADPLQLVRIRSDAKKLWLEGSQRSADWQGVVDMIVKRFGDRIQHLAMQPHHQLFLQEISTLLNTFINYESFSLEKSISTCTSHYLRPVKVSTEQDQLILAAISAVTQRICETLFEVRADLLAQDNEEDELVDTTQSVEKIRELIKWLDWSEWKMCRPSCSYDQVCYITVVPWGTTPLHYNPCCLNSSEIEELYFDEDNYWFPGDFP